MTTKAWIPAFAGMTKDDFMKILFLTRRAWPSVGGVEKHVLEVSRWLVEMGNEVTVIAEDDDVGFIRPPLADQPMSHRLARAWPLTSPREGLSFETRRIPVGRNEKLKKFRIWGWLWKHRDLIKDADIVHVHDVGFWYWPFRFLYSRKPFFITFHGWEEKFPVYLSHKIQRKISEKMARGNICVGDFLKKWYGTKADYVTHGGVIIPPPRGSTSHTPEVRTVFIGRLEEQTGIMAYLKALKILDSRFGSATLTILSLSKDRGNDKRSGNDRYGLTILGDGPLRNKIEQYIKKNKLNVSILGFVNDPEKYLQKADFVFTSGYLAILEAMGARKLVFSVFENPLKEDYLKMTPFKKFIIICQTPEELGEKIKYYSKNQKETDKLTEEAYNWVKGETWGKVAEIYLKLYES